MVSENISLLSIIFLRLCHDDVESIFPVLYEVKHVVASALSSVWHLLPDGWLAHKVENWFEYLPVFIDISGQVQLLWLTLKSILTPSSLSYFSFDHALMMHFLLPDFSCQLRTLSIAWIDHYILIYHQGHVLMLWPSIKHTRVEQNSKNITMFFLTVKLWS